MLAKSREDVKIEEDAAPCGGEKGADGMENQESWEPYKVVLTEGQGELVEKKSRFIANIRPVKSEEEAAAFIEEMKKKYWDARHNCSAFVIGRRGELARCSDDGEPPQTAGRPMLEVLLGEEIRNVAVVVTRYFGGTLLGTGGLVRAYAGAVKAGLAACRVGVMRFGVRLSVDTDYNGIGKIQYILGKYNISPEKTDYTERVRMQVLVPKEKADALCRKITEATAAKAVLTKMEQLYFVDEKD